MKSVSTLESSHSFSRQGEEQSLHKGGYEANFYNNIIISMMHPSLRSSFDMAAWQCGACCIYCKIKKTLEASNADMSVELGCVEELFLSTRDCLHACLPHIRQKWVNEKCLVHLFHRIKPGGCKSILKAVHIIGDSSWLTMSSNV